MINDLTTFRLSFSYTSGPTSSSCSHFFPVEGGRFAPTWARSGGVCVPLLSLDSAVSSSSFVIYERPQNSESSTSSGEFDKAVEQLDGGAEGVRGMVEWWGEVGERLG